VANRFGAPKLLAFLICDATFRDPTTKKLTLLGLFNQINATTFPCKHAKLNVFLSLTDGRGTAKGCLKLVHKASEKVVLELSGKVEFKDPLGTTELDFELRNIPFPEAGAYSFDFYCDEELIAQRPFHVIEVSGEKK